MRIVIIDYDLCYNYHAELIIKWFKIKIKLKSYQSMPDG